MSQWDHIKRPRRQSPLPWILLEFLTVRDFIKLKVLNSKSYYQESANKFFGGAIRDSPVINYLRKIGNLNQSFDLGNQALRMNAWK